MLVFFLNELSVSEQVLEIAEARKRALMLVRVLRKIRSKQRNMAVNSAVSLKNALLDQRYSVSEVLAGNKYTEEWLLLKDISDRHPFAEGLGEQFDPETQGIGYDYCGREAIALGWADQLGTAVISFAGESEWSEAHLSVLRYEADSRHDIQESEVSIRNFSETEHVLLHEDWLQTSSFEWLFEVGVFWQQRETLFPYLRFLKRAESDMDTLRVSGAAYYLVLQRLNELNQDVARWVETTGDWPVFSSKATPEDETRKRLCEVMDNGEKHNFHWHLRFTGGIAGRIHFRICVQEQKAIIAYIGKKLDAPIVQSLIHTH